MSRRSRLAAAAVVLALLVAPGWPAAFDDGRQAFDHIYKVATHPRCVNCHGAGTGPSARPLVGETMEPHPMNITLAHNTPRELAERTTLGIECVTCHQDRNLPERGTPPGAQGRNAEQRWRMPPDADDPRHSMRILSIRLRGQVSKGEAQRDLCLVWANFRKHDDIEGHITNDPLIAWAFEPGQGRERAPDGLERLKEAVAVWVRWLDTGGGSCEALAR